MQRYLLILVGLLLFFASTAQATEIQPIPQLIENLCLEQDVSSSLVMAIAEHESRLNPFAINISGKGYYPKEKGEAQALIEKAIKSGASYDVGVMQVNNYWIKKLQLDPVSLLDPQTNISLGVNILKNEIGRHGFTWKAVGSYHSPNSTRSNHYAWLIYNKAMKHNKNPQKIIARSSHSVDQQKQHGLVVLRNKTTNNSNPQTEDYNEQKTENPQSLLYVRGNASDHRPSNSRKLVCF